MNTSRFRLALADRYALVMIACGVGLRLLLIALGWPPTNSDEGTMGVMALNIAYHGAHPSMYYGQNYMGVSEAYLGAFFFHLFGGPSLFALRFGVVLMVAIFFGSTYLLARLLFSPRVGLASILTLSIGSIPFLTRQTIATGGSSQTLMFGSLAFLLVAWLALSYRRTMVLRMRWQRLAAYAGLGLVIGLGLWSDMIVLPFLAMAGLLLLLFCWRELLIWAWMVLLLFMLVGIAPLIRYDLAQGLNPVQILLGLAHGSNSVAPGTLHEILHNLKNTLLVSLPTATGDPFCPVIELQVLGDNSPHTPVCTIAHASWGLGYVLLLGGALLSSLMALQRIRMSPKGEERGTIVVVRRMVQLSLLSAALLTLVVYVMSSGPVSWPGFHARYLIGLLIATPALLEPLVRGISGIKPVRRACWAVLVLIWSLLLIGTGIAFSEVPAAWAGNEQRVDLISRLERIGARHIYTEYWTCNNLALASNEGVICAVLDADLKPSHNRVPGYYERVKADPRAAYVFPRRFDKLPVSSDSLAAVERMVKEAPPGSYRRYEFDGYVVYQPAG